MRVAVVGLLVRRMSPHLLICLRRCLALLCHCLCLVASGGLADEVDESILAAAFRPFGDLRLVMVPRDATTRTTHTQSLAAARPSQLSPALAFHIRRTLSRLRFPPISTSVAAVLRAALASNVGKIPSSASPPCSLASPPLSGSLLTRSITTASASTAAAHCCCCCVSEKHRGFGFVEMEDPADATAALENMNDSELMGRVIRCNLARPATAAKQGVWAHQSDAEEWLASLGKDAAAVDAQIAHQQNQEAKVRDRGKWRMEQRSRSALTLLPALFLLPTQARAAQ